MSRLIIFSFLFSGLLSAQGFLVKDERPALYWGRDTGPSVRHQVLAATGGPTITSTGKLILRVGESAVGESTSEFRVDLWTGSSWYALFGYQYSTDWLRPGKDMVANGTENLGAPAIPWLNTYTNYLHVKQAVADCSTISGAVDTSILCYDGTDDKLEINENNTGWVPLSGPQLPVVDTQTIVKGSADPTKLIRFEVDGLTTANTRVLTVQDSDYTLAGIDITQIFTTTQTIQTPNASFTPLFLKHTSSSGAAGLWLLDTGGGLRGHLQWNNSGYGVSPNYMTIGTNTDNNLALKRNNNTYLTLDPAQVTNWSHFVPQTGNTYDLGTEAVGWRDLFLMDQVRAYSAASSINHEFEAEGNATLYAIAYGNLTTDRGGYNMDRARGSKAVKVTVLPGDRLGVIGARGYVVDTFTTSARINFMAESVNGSGANRIVGGGIYLATQSAAGALTDHWKINSSGGLETLSLGSIATAGSPLLNLHTYNLYTYTAATIAGSLNVQTATVTGHFLPSLIGTHDLGSTSNRWNNTYTNYLNTTYVSSALIPSTGSAFDLGSSSLRWNTGYLNYLNTNFVSSSLVPSTDNAYSLGSSGGVRWNSLWVNYIGNATYRVVDTYTTNINISASVTANGSVGVNGSLNCPPGQAITTLSTSLGIVTGYACGVP